MVPWSVPAFLLAETTAGPRASGEVGKRLPRAAPRVVAPKNKKATSRSQTRRLLKGCDLGGETVLEISAKYLPRKRLPTLFQHTAG